MSKNDVKKEKSDKEEDIIEETVIENCKENKPRTGKGIKIFCVIISLITAASAVSQAKLWSDNMRMKDIYETQVSVNKQLLSLLETASNGTETEASKENNASNRGSWEELPPAIEEKIQGTSLTEDSPVKADALAYLTIPYCDYDGGISTGHMIVAKELADEVLDIFEELTNNEYPIKSMELIEDFEDKQTAVLNSVEAAAKGNNNTSGLMYGKDSSGKADAEAAGRAVTLNPEINPEVTAEGTMPRNAIDYKNRENVSLDGTIQWAFLREDSDAVKIFEKHGWKWCGSEGNYGCFIKE